MNSALLSKVQENLDKFKSEHKGEAPLYILVSPHEADELYGAVKADGGYNQDVLVTEFKGSKIVKYDALKKGDIRVTNELPGD